MDQLATLPLLDELEAPPAALRGDSQSLVHRLQHKYADRITGSILIPGRPGEFTALPKDLPPQLAAALRTRGIAQLYSHQAEAWHAVREGKLILASNFDKERANETPGVDTYDRVATPKELAASASSREDKLVGNWKVDVSLADQTVDYGLRIAKADGKLAATLISPRSGEHKAKSATYKADELVMEFDREYQGNSVTLTYRGKLIGDELSGTVTAKGFEDQYNGKWKAKKN